MTKTEIERRLATMGAETVVQVDRMITEGYGAVGIAQNAMVEITQANAVFAARKLADWPTRLNVFKKWAEADAQEWSDSCKAMRKAEGDHYDGYDVEAQADLAAPTYAEEMGWDDCQNIDPSEQSSGVYQCGG